VAGREPDPDEHDGQAGLLGPFLSRHDPVEVRLGRVEPVDDPVLHVHDHQGLSHEPDSPPVLFGPRRPGQAPV
jgi:hypothetical protein